MTSVSGYANEWLIELESEIIEWLPIDIFRMIRAHLSTPVKILSTMKDWRITGNDGVLVPHKLTCQFTPQNFTYHPLRHSWIVSIKQPRGYCAVGDYADLLLEVNDSMTAALIIAGYVSSTNKMLFGMDGSPLSSHNNSQAFSSINGLVVDHLTGDVFVTDHCRICCVDLDSKIVTTVAGSDPTRAPLIDRIRQRQQLDQISSLFYDGKKILFNTLSKLCIDQRSGNLYVLEFQESIYQLVRKLGNSSNEHDMRSVSYTPELVRKSRCFDVIRIYYQPVIDNFDLSPSSDELIVNFRHYATCLTNGSNKTIRACGLNHELFNICDLRYSYCGQRLIMKLSITLDFVGMGWLDINSAPTSYSEIEKFATVFVDMHVDPPAAQLISDTQDMFVRNTYIYFCTKSGLFGVVLHCL